MSAKSRLTVLQSSRAPRSTTNPYLSQLVLSLPPDVDVCYFTWPTALLGRYEILHVHWPDLLYRGRGRLRTRARQVMFAVLMLRIRLCGTAVVRTAHNLAPHEDGHRIENLLTRWLTIRTTLWITLNDHTPVPARARQVTILHGHYREWFARYSRTRAVPGRLTYFGLIRPYKGVPALCTAFEQVDADQATLRIVGAPSSTTLADQIAAACQRDPRISATLTYVDDATLAAEIGAAQLIVLPYEDMQNSGALLLALSLDRPVLVPHTEANAALRAEVGEAWIHMYQPPLSAPTLIGALRSTGQGDRPSKPDLTARDWPELGRQHLRAYRRATRDTAPSPD